MNKKHLIIAIAGALVAAGVVAQSVPPPPSTFYGCKDGSGNITSIREGTAPTCKRGQTLTSWNNQGPAGTNGTNGLDGEDGQDGRGVRVWKDANGNEIGMNIGTGLQFATGAVELNIAGKRFALAVPMYFDDSSGINRITKYGAFIHTSIARPPTRYSTRPDCAPPHYYMSEPPPTGYDAGYTYHRHAYDGPEAGRVDLLILSEAGDPITVLCYIPPEGFNIEVNQTLYEPRTIVQTINLTDTYPAPLTLE